MPADIDSLIDIGLDVLSTSMSATGKILAFLGDAKNKLATSDRASWVQHVGFASRPGKPTAGKQACQAVVVRRSDQDVVIASSDSRTQEMYGALSDGETALIAGGPDGTSQARVILKADGSANVYTRAGNSAGGAGMVLQLDAANNASRMLNGLGFGIIADANGVTITSGAASITLGADGSISIVATGQAQVDGSTILLGSIAVPGVNSAIRGPTGLSGVASPKVLIQ